MSTNSEPCLGKTGSSFLARRYLWGLGAWLSALLFSFMLISSAGLLSLDFEGRLSVWGAVQEMDDEMRHAHVEDACPC